MHPTEAEQKQQIEKSTFYVFGGLDCTSTVAYHSSAESFDVEAGNWKPMPEMTLQRCEFAAAATGDSIYILGGRLGNDYLSSGEVYNLVSEEWTPLPPMKLKRRGLAAIAFESTVYALGGRCDNATYLSSGERFDPQSQSWSSLPRMGSKRSAHCSAILDGALYVMGGHDGTTSFSSAERFHISSDTWQALPDMDTHRINAAAAAFTLDQKPAVYVFGGSSLSSVERFIPTDILKQNPLNVTEAESLGGWISLKPMGSLRCRHIAVPVVMNESIYIMGGHDGTNYLSSVERYSFRAHAWSTEQPMKTKRCDLGGVCIEVIVQPEPEAKPEESVGE